VFGRELLAVQPMTSATSIAPRPFAPHTALVVGDNRQAESLLLESPSSVGWQICRAADNPAALCIARESPFDVVLTSRNASAAEGVEFLRALLRIQPCTRVIVLACDASAFNVLDAIREHAFSFFARDYDAQSLSEIVQLAAGNARWDDGVKIVSATDTWISALVRCDLDSADRWMQFLKELLANLPPDARQSVALAAREVLPNAVEYGDHVDARKFIDFSCVRTRRMVACRIVDPGEGFHVGHIPQAAIDNPPGDAARHIIYRQEHGMRPGGFGVLVARQSLDELLYNEKGNESLLVKYLNPA